MKNNSMTGFGRGEASSDNHQVVVELKTVNNRYRDFRFRMSSILSFHEMKMRETLTTHFKRGSFDISINFKKTQVNSQFDHLDIPKIERYMDTINASAKAVKVDVEVRPTEFLRNEFFLEEDRGRLGKDIQILVDNALADAISELATCRGVEGDKLVEIINNHKKNYENFLQTVDEGKEEYQKIVDDRIRKKLEELGSTIEIDKGRFNQELVYHLEKLDISEEIERVKVHMTRLETILNKDGEKGRELDFLIQELNRETNTIASKSGKDSISDSVVSMKVELEKIREQALNME